MNAAAWFLHGGRIHTPGPAGTVEALAISQNGLVLAAGTVHEMETLCGSGTKKINLEGRAVYPGFADAHIHFLDYCLSLGRLDLHDADMPAVLALLRKKAAQAAPDEWILGHGWSMDSLGLGRFPLASELDAIAPNHPVVFYSHDYHALWCNSAALRAAGLTSSTPEPPGGKIERLPDGRPAGVLLEAWQLVQPHIPQPDDARCMEALRTGFRLAAGLGLTSLHDFSALRAMDFYRRLHENGELPCRIYKTVLDAELDAAAARGLKTGLGDEWIRIGPCKIFSDGALGSRSAAMHRPYAGGHDCGLLVHEPAALEERMRRALGRSFSLAVHAIGDRANTVVLDAYERIGRAPAGLPPHRIEHAQHVRREDISRFASLGVAASMQPFHMQDDIPILDSALREHESLAFPFAALHKAGEILAFGSDAPIASPDPRLGLRAACTASMLEVSAPHAAIGTLSFDAALRAYTSGVAALSRESAFKGTLEPGKTADLVVMERDFSRCPPDEWPENKVAATMTGGRWVFNALE